MDHKFVFDSNNPNWVRDIDHNRLFLQSIQRYFNDRLQRRGHVFLNEVYDALDMPRTREGQVMGWTIGKPIAFDFEVEAPVIYITLVDDGEIFGMLPSENVGV